MKLSDANLAELCALFRKTGIMSTVLKITCSEEKPAQFMMGALFTRICAEATALEAVVM